MFLTMAEVQIDAKLNYIIKKIVLKNVDVYKCTNANLSIESCSDNTYCF